MSNTATNTPGAYPGGSSGQIQYNNAGAFGAVTGTTSDGTNITGMSIKSSFDLKGSASGSITISGGSAVTSHSLILPSAIGSAGQVLGISNAGTGQLMWADSQSPGLTGSLHTSSPNNTVNASRLIASGGTTNQDAVISAKGSGAFQLQVADGTATGGNKRGFYAIDLQLSRSLATHIASGHSSFTAGYDNASLASGSVAVGWLNTSSSNYSVSMGYNNTTGPTGYSSVAIGYNNTAYNSATVAIGSLNIASGVYSVAIGYNSTSNNTCSVAIGNSTTASGGSSVALGHQSNASLWGQVAIQGDYFAGSGKSQQFLINCSGTTTNSTPKELFLDGGSSQRLTVPNNTSYVFTILINGHRTDDVDAAAYQFLGMISNRAGATAIVGSVTKNVVAETDSSWDADVTADNTNDALVITVTGATGKNISWEAAFWVAQVSS